MTYNELAEALTVTPEELDQILIQYPFTESDVKPAAPLYSNEQLRKDFSSFHTPEELDKLAGKWLEASMKANDVFLNEYRSFIVENEAEFFPRLRNLIEELREDMNAGESFLDYFNRQEEELQNFLSLVPAKPRSFKPERAKNIVMPDTLLIKQLPEIVNKGDVEIITGKARTRGKPISEHANITLLYTDSEGVQIDGNYDPFNDPVLIAFISLWLAGNTVITPEMIQRFFSQDFKTKSLSYRSEEDIIKAVHDLSLTRVNIDITEEAKRRNWNVDKLTPGSYMLAVREIPVKIGGVEKIGWTLIETPPILAHAYLSGQLITRPASLLIIKDRKTGKRRKTSKNRTTLVLHLLQQVEDIKKDAEKARKTYKNYVKKSEKDPISYPEKPFSSFRQMSSVISYESLFKRTGLSGKSNKELQDYKEYTKDCLQTWKESGEIKNFFPHGNGKETGVRIVLNGD